MINMHFTLVLALPQNESLYSFLEPYCDMAYDREDDGTVIGPDGTVYKDGDEVPFTFYDWFQLGGRRDGYIKGKRSSKPVIKMDRKKNYKKENPEIDWANRGSAFIKKDIKYFGYYEKDAVQFPQVYSYMDVLGKFHEKPSSYEFEDEDGNCNVVEYHKAEEEFFNAQKEWYESVPDDYVIYLIDYHM